MALHRQTRVVRGSSVLRSPDCCCFWSLQSPTFCQLDLAVPGATTRTLLFKYFPRSQGLRGQGQIPPPSIRSAVTQSMCRTCFSIPSVTLHAPWASCPALPQLHGSDTGGLFFFLSKGLPSSPTSLEVQPKYCLLKRSLNPEEVTSPSSECPLLTLATFLICNQTTNPRRGKKH